MKAKAIIFNCSALMIRSLSCGKCKIVRLRKILLAGLPIIRYNYPRRALLFRVMVGSAEKFLKAVTNFLSTH